MSKKITIEGSNLLTDVSQPWGGVNDTGSPREIYGTEVPAGAEWGVNRGEVERFIKKVFGSKAGEFYNDVEAGRYLVFADAASRDLYLSDPEEYADLLLASFDAPANYVAEISMQTPASNVVLSGSTDNFLDFTFDIVNRAGSSTGEPVIADITFTNGGNSVRITQIYNAGTNVHLLIDDYLKDGLNFISIFITGRTTLARTLASVTYSVVALEFTSSFDFSKGVPSGNYLTIPYYLEGAGVKYIEWYLDGVKMPTVDTVTELKVNRTKNIDVSQLQAGKHNVQARAYITESGTNYYSKTLYFDFVAEPVSWDNNVTFVLLGLNIDVPTNSAPSLTVIQYKTLNYDIAVYDSRSRVLSLQVLDNASVVQTVSMLPSEITSKEYSPTTVGVHTVSFNADGSTASIIVTATASDVDINEETDGLLLKLSAKGRSNNETNPAVWAYGAYSTVFNNFSWNERSGWNNNALVIPAGSSIDINFTLLGGNPLTNGRTIEIDYETTNIKDDDASVINLVNSSTGARLQVTASSATLQSSGGANVNTKYKDGDRVHLAFIINKVTGDDARLMYIVNNGTAERAAAFQSTDTFSVADALHIGSTHCTVKIYSIRVYDKALPVDTAFGNFAIDQENLVEIADRNDILNSQTGLIDADKVNAKIPIIIITGNMQPIFDATDKNTTVYVDMEYRNMQDPTKNFTATHVRMRPQGTSSLGYPRKNLRPYTSSQYGCVMLDAAGNVIEDGLYAFKNGSQPVNCWTLKSDYAESSGSHNTGAARLWNNILYGAQLNGQFAFRTEAQKAALENGYNYDVRTTVDGFPIVVFYHEHENEELICLGQYNFNNDKSTEKVFGFKDIPGFDNTNVQCFEFLANENPICLFDDVSNFDNGWSDAFESRYPDTKTPNLTPLKTLATWINNCKNNQSKWNTEKAQHFNLPMLAAYYVYLMRFGAVDQPVKNAMITTEDGVHWFFINYDNDTVLGIDNISTVLNAWNYDRKSQKAGGSYYYAGHNSVLWNCFEADPECMALVSEVDTALYSAGLTYANMIHMFDNEQCDKWCERLYNDNGRYKYITPYQDSGSAVLYMLQGSRKSYRHWWLQHRMDLYDAKWSSGAFRNRVVRFIAEGAQGGTFSITSAANTYFGYGINSVAQEVGVYIAENASHDFTIAQTLAIGDPVSIYNANNAVEVDLSGFAQKLTTLYINQAVGNDGQSNLKRLILGDGETENVVFTQIGGLAAITSLEEIDIRYFTAMTAIELGALTNLHKLKAANSGLTSFAPAAGVTLTEVSLPATIQSITLNNAVVTALTYTPTTTLRYISLRGVSGAWNEKSFVLTWLGMLSAAQLADATLILTGINWTGMTAAQVLLLGSAGNTTLQGRVTLDSLTQEEYNALVEMYGQNVFEKGGSFVIDAPTNVFISGPSLVKEGGTGTFTATFFPVTESAVKYLLYNGTTLVESQTDQQGNVYRTYNGVTLYEATGVMNVGSIESDVAVKVRAQVDGTSSYSSYIDVTAQKITYPTAVTISGAGTVNSNGMYNYTKSLSGTYNAEVTNVAWSLSSNSASTLYSSDNNSATVNVTNTPATSIDVTLTCTVTFQGGVTRTGTKTITMQLTYPSSVSISGDASLSDNGNFDYTWSENGSKTASVTNVAWSLTSNEYVTCAGSDTKATLTIANGNPTAVTLTLSLTVTYTGGVTRSTTKSISVDVIEEPSQIVVPDAIDLGLPSGKLWASWNIGASSEEDYGAYFSWGNVDPHFPTSESSFSPYTWGNSNSGSPYKDTHGATIPFTSLTLNAAYSADSGYDAARELFGGKWRVPTAKEFKELYDNTDSEWITINGVNGRKFMKKTDHSVYVFFPAVGGGDGSFLNASGTHGYYWSSSLNEDNRGYNFSFNNSKVTPLNSSNRYVGRSVRAIIDIPPVKSVDLGLPSGTLWADRNVGATAPEDKGDFFSWGNVVGHKSSGDNEVSDDNYDFETDYPNTTGNSVDGNIGTSEYDAASTNLAGNWRMPTKSEFEELINNTDLSTVTVNGVLCAKFTNRTDSTKYILIPCSGIFYSSSRYDLTYVYLWTRTRESTYWSYLFNIIYSNPAFSRPSMTTIQRYNGMPIRGIQ